MPNTVMPFMAAQIDAQKQVTFNSPLDHKVEKMADKLDMCHDLKEILRVQNFYYICQICYLRLGLRSSGFAHD